MEKGSGNNSPMGTLKEKVAAPVGKHVLHLSLLKAQGGEKPQHTETEIPLYSLWNEAIWKVNRKHSADESSPPPPPLLPKSYLNGKEFTPAGMKWSLRRPRSSPSYLNSDRCGWILVPNVLPRLETNGIFWNWRSVVLL